jgi:class 3 adenylate cyclase
MLSVAGAYAPAEDHSLSGRATLASERVERPAILAADVAGYSRLMGVDEEGTLAQLKAHRTSR